MKIAVVGTQCTGKSTFINDFLNNWPIYKRATGSYREKAKELGITLNEDGCKKDQMVIRDILVEQIEKNKDEKYVIFDRCPLDNLIYSIWLNYKNKGDVDDLFIEQSIVKTKRALKNLDIIFYIPLLEKYPVELVKDELRSVNKEFRTEIDNIFKAVFKTYHRKEDTFFDMRDVPAVIEIFGKPEERIEMAKLYINPEGDMFGSSALE